jgi:hypothetical protein
MYRKALILLLMCGLFCGTASAKEPEFNVDVFFGWDGCYRPMEWTPVEIGISSARTDPFEGTVRVSAQQDDLNTLNISHGFVLTPEIPSHIPLVTKFAFAADSCSVELRSNRRKRVWSNTYDLYYSSKPRLLTAINEEDMLIGLIGGRRFNLIQLANKAVSTSARGTGEVYVKDKTPRMAPWDWTGLVSLDTLILYDPDYSLLRGEQLEAIVQWVSNGGRLLVVLGINPLVSGNPIAELIPFEIGEARQVDIDGGTLEHWGLINSSEKEEVVCRPLTPKSSARIFKTDRDADGLCLFGVGCVGFGRVGVLGFDPHGLSAKQRAESSEFWVDRLTAVMGESDIAARSRNSSSVEEFSTLRRIVLSRNAGNNRNQNNMGRNFQTGIAQAGSNAVMEHLYSIVEMRPLSIGWVILILVLLAVLLGPVDYLVLKRKGRLPLTWLTSTGWIILFTVGAYYGVQALRGGSMQMRTVSVTDGISDDCKWSTAYTGMYAPSTDDYALDGMTPTQWFSGITPTQSRLYSYKRSNATRNIYCSQHDGANLPVSLPINIWTMQCLLTESPVDIMPFKAEVSRDRNEVSVSIENLSDEPIKAGHVLFSGNMALDFGAVASGETKQFSGRLKSRRDDMYETMKEYQRNSSYSNNQRYANHKAYVAQGSLRRTIAMHDYMSHGAAVVHAEYTNTSTPFVVKNRTCDYSHIQLVRLVVFPDEMKEQAK